MYNDNKQSYILVTGGAGYIGSHTTLLLLQAGYKVVVIDNLCNSYKKSIKRVRKLANAQKGDLIFVKADLKDKKSLNAVFRKFNITSVIHFAGLKSVSESQDHPIMYYQNNVLATVSLLETMVKYHCHNIVFSSSATVYGDTKEPYIKEDAPTNPLTPYGRSKLMCEHVIQDVCKNKQVSAVILRYFNPVGCHPSGLLGENPKGTPNNLMPCLTKAMVANKPLKLYGDDYDTKDGTAVRDFIHVMDLGKGHIDALNKLEHNGAEKQGFCQVYNMGNGHGSSVMQVVLTMTKVAQQQVLYDIVERRVGDAECVVANPTKAMTQLGWMPKHTLDEMCSSAWYWTTSSQGEETKSVSLKTRFGRLSRWSVRLMH
jgi:UDP-glucose 4-epimerase